MLLNIIYNLRYDVNETLVEMKKLDIFIKVH